MEKLMEILRLRRGHKSEGEMECIEKFIAPLAPQIMMNDKQEIIAFVVEVGGFDANRILWSCHVDTVHRADPLVLHQDVFVGMDGVMFVTEKADCLGADDGAGMWLMLEMIQAGKGGTYIFHRGEEIGCWGSKQMVQFHKNYLKGFTHAIAFDRRGTSSIITHQRGERACSDALGTMLIDLLGMGHELDPTGVYTDTAEYMDIIPECVNVSIGYENEHSDFETLDTTYLKHLRDAMCSIDWHNVKLPVVRDPSVTEYRQYAGSSFSGWNSYKDKYDGLFDREEIPDIEALMNCSMGDIEDWCEKTDVTNVAYLIASLADKIAELQYEEQYESGHLNVGLH